MSTAQTRLLKTSSQHQPTAQGGARPLRGVWQDKGAPTRGRAATAQPVVHKNSARTRGLNTASPRSQNYSKKRRTVQISGWCRPQLKAELERIAKEQGLSLSQVVVSGLEQWALWNIHEQQEAFFYPKLRQIMREEREASENRIVFFLMRIAIASEQSRILTTELLKRFLFFLFGRNAQQTRNTPGGEPSAMETLDAIRDKSYDMARANVFRKSTEMKSMLAEWEAWNKEGSKKHE